MSPLQTPKPPRPPAPPAAPQGLGRRRTRAGAGDVPPLHPLGRRFLKKGSVPHLRADWCVPWPTFVGAHTSLTEQMIYRAWALVTGDPPDPSQPPYVGGVTWTYQGPLLGGRAVKGGQVCDFVVQWGGEELCIRLQSAYFHVMADQAKKADEAFEKSHARGRIIDIYEQDFAGDCTGEAACRVIANALAGRDAPDPGSRGTADRVRRRGGSRTS